MDFKLQNVNEIYSKKFVNAGSSDNKYLQFSKKLTPGYSFNDVNILDIIKFKALFNHPANLIVIGVVVLFSFLIYLIFINIFY